MYALFGKNSNENGELKHPIPDSGCGQTDVVRTEVAPMEATQAPSAILASLPKPSRSGGPSARATSISHLPALEEASGGAPDGDTN